MELAIKYLIIVSVLEHCSGSIETADNEMPKARNKLAGRGHIEDEDNSVIAVNSTIPNSESLDINNASVTLNLFSSNSPIMPNARMIMLQLESVEVKNFLSSIGNMNKRVIIREQLRACPAVPLCNISLTFEDMNADFGCCKPCRCDEDCLERHDCCPDILPDSLFMYSADDILPVHNRPCILLNLLVQNEGASRMTGMHVVAMCPENGTPQSRRCLMDYHSDYEIIKTISDIVPVTDKRDGVTYRNRYCALCNGLGENFLVAWQVKLSCETHFRFVSEKELVQSLLKGDIRCDIQFVDSSNVSLETDTCALATSICTTRSTPLIRHACQLYRSPFQMENEIYSNVFCASCNWEHRIDISCAQLDSKTANMFPFSGLLRLEAENIKEPSEISNCPNGTMYNELLKQCLEISCSELRRLVNGQCVPVFGTSSWRTLYHQYLRVMLSGDVDLRTAYSLASLLKLPEGFRLAEGVYGHVCGKQVLLKVRRRDGAEVFSINSANEIDFLYFDVRLEIHIRMKHQLEVVADELNNITTRNFSLEYQGELFDGYVEEHDDLPQVYDLNGLAVPGIGIEFGRDVETAILYCQPDINDRTLFIPLLDSDINKCIERFGGSPPVIRTLTLQTCPLVTIYKQYMPWQIHATELEFTEINQTLSLSNFFYDNRKDAIKMCLEKYEALISNSSLLIRDDAPREISLESILSIILISLSLVSLLITIFVYSILKTLRNLPGMNNMALSSSLFLAQLTYLVSSFSGFESEGVACKTIGLTLHCLWLLALFWMNVCTYHMAHVLSKTRVMQQTGNVKRHVLYHVYCISMSLLVVAINVTVSLITSDSKNMGYGKFACYISSQLMVSLTFGIPVILVVVANIGMFVRIVRTLFRSREAHKQTQHERQELLVLVKLSSITGITWIFGFIYQWSHVAVFSYLFTIFNACQGIFILFAFILNKRVLNLFKGKLTPRSQESTPVTLSTRG